MGSTLIITVAYIFLVLVALLTRLISAKCKVGKKMWNFLKDKLFFGFIIQILISSYMEIMIAGYLNIKQPIWTKNGETIGVYLGYIYLFLIFFVLPITYIYVINRPILELENP